MLDLVGEVFPYATYGILVGLFTIAMVAMVRGQLRASRRGEQAKEDVP